MEKPTTIPSHPVSPQLLRVGAALLALGAAALARSGESDTVPRDTELFRQMRLTDPASVHVPSLPMKRIVQLPNRAPDPLADAHVTRAGAVRRVQATEGGMVVETEGFLLTLTVQGEGLHVTARRQGAADAEVYPALAFKERLPRPAVVVREDADAVTLARADSGAEVARVLRADGTIELPPAAAGAARDRYSVVHSRLDGRVYVVSPLAADERLYGLGMKGGALDRRGRRYTMWNTDKFAHTEDFDPIYASVPFLLRKAGPGARGLFVDDASDVVFDLGHTRAGEALVSTTSAQADFHLFAAPRVAGVIAAYQALTGTAPLPPVWALGYHQSAHTYFPAARVLEVAETFRKKGIPADALYLDIVHQDQYRPFTWNAEHFPDPQGLIARLHGLGFKVVTIVNPGIQANDGYSAYIEGRDRGLFLRAGDGRIYVNNVWPGYSAFPDFLQPEARAWWAGLHGTYLDQGVDGFKNDMSEPATFMKDWATLRYDEKTDMPGPLEAGTLEDHVVSRSAPFGTRPHRAWHNAYSLYQSEATARALAERDGRRPFVLMRNTFSSGQRFATIWTGDVAADFPSLRNTVQLLLSLGLSGFPVSGADNGGFVGRTTPELMLRWTAQSVFSPYFRTHYFWVDQSIDKEPWSFGPEVEAQLAALIRVRYRLLPYLYTSLRDSIDRRAPLMAPLFLGHEDDPAAWDVTDQYTWGDAFLVAPVLEPGVRSRAVYLPKGKWYDFWTGEALASAGETRRIAAPVERIPVFVRAGTIVPTMEPPASTAGAFPLRHVILDAWPAADGSAAGTVYLDDGATRDYAAGRSARAGFRLTRTGQELRLELDATGDRSFLPARMTLRVRGWTAATGPARVRFGGADFPLRATDGAGEAEIPLR